MPAKANGKEEAIIEAEKLNLIDRHLYYSLLGNLYEGIGNSKAKECLQRSYNLARTTIIKSISPVKREMSNKFLEKKN